MASNLVPAAIIIPLVLFVGTLKSEIPHGANIVAQTYSSSGFLQVGDVVVGEESYRFLRRDAGVVGSVAIEVDKEDPSIIHFGDALQVSSVLGDAAYLAADVGTNKALVM